MSRAGESIGWLPVDPQPSPSQSTSQTARRKIRPVPSPLQESTTARSASDISGPLSPGTPSSSIRRAVYSQDTIPTTANAPRAPNPAKRVPTSPAIEEFRSAVTRDALKDEARSRTAQSRNVSAPVLAAAPQLSPPTSPTMASSSTSKPSHRAELRSIDERTIMPRTASIDSTFSTVSTATTGSQKHNGSTAYRVTQESAGPEDVAALIAGAGSAEAVVQKLLGDKNQAASHNAQLWRLVEKQRAMILGLNKDLEKALKEKERYRRKLKDHLVESQSAPVLTSAADDMRENSQSPALRSGSARDIPSVATVAGGVRKFSEDSRKASDASDLASVPGRSDTPQETITQSSSDTQPGTPRSADSGSLTSRDGEHAGSAPSTIKAAHSQRPSIDTAPTLANRGEPLRTPLSATAPQQSPSLPAPGNSLSSPKAANRKAPPAPLQLSPKSVAPTSSLANNIIGASDSEYEEDPDSARAEYELRGRRKTREEDDKEREEIAKQEEEYRSRSKKQSKSKTPAETTDVASDVLSPAAPQPAAVQPAPEERLKAQHYQGNADPTAIIRQRALSDAAGMLQKSITAPSLLSPGLPMSPRPIDKPLNSPMPRAPKTGLSAIPMSPRAGLPMSPRAPRHPLPLPPQTPLTISSPHLARATEYHQQAQLQQSSLADRLKASPEPSPDNERPSTSSDPNPKSPGEVYRGLVVEQYPELLLPPNALPSIYIKTSSSRMKPSRQSYIVPKHENESPVLTLAVYERSDRKQLWRVEKTVASLVLLDTQIKSACSFRDRMPDKALFTGHSPAKIDARRAALDSYFDRMLDALENEKAARIVCKFLSSDAMGAESGDYFGNVGLDPRPDTPVAKHRTQKAGYLTKRGKNFGGWKARYFVLDGPQLKYFEAPGGAHMGSIKLQNAQIGKQSNSAAGPQEDEDNQYRHAFLVLEPKKKDSSSLVRHVLCAESDEERDAWVEALLQYVDFRDEEEDILKGTQAVRPDISGARSPRLQKSMNDLRPSSRSRDPSHLAPDSVRALHYNDTRPGEAPIIGVPIGGSKSSTPSPPVDGSFTPTQEHPYPAQHPMISGPTNLHVISNAGDWGMKVPPTPQGKEHAKDKKRSIFTAFRGRSSSDLAPTMMSPALPPSDQRSAAGVRAVFGVPLAEAVHFAHPSDATTELPAVVYRCIQYLTFKDAIAEEGIFRLSGSNTVIKSLKDRFNNEGDVNLVAEDHHYDIHAVASLLKLYFRELPASILTRDLHLEFLQCLELHGHDKVIALNILVNRLPRPNRALLQALAQFLLSIVNNADVNKMNVRNVGIVFAPTLNVPAPLISSFVEDQAEIFGPPFDEAESPVSATEIVPQFTSTDLRSPRKQMFSDLPTPAYNQTTFQPMNGDTGMIPMQPSYANYQMAPQGEGGFGSLNDALRSPTVYGTTNNGAPTPREVKSKRRESGMDLLNTSSYGPQKKTSMSRLREEGASF
ncbi:Rho GTPase activating protein [Elasticomyces elasticus]|uniref:Rho GTPase activating protein n=1 Tax=Elasticomyces elasticus TaxID=574655 RepID=A0AAN7VLV9_9PEZI|nr:Rho GTPase activating protein [Elasticomyces elasticus]